MPNYNRYATTSISYSDMLQHTSSTTSTGSWYSSWHSVPWSSLSFDTNFNTFKVRDKKSSLLQLNYNKKQEENI